MFVYLSKLLPLLVYPLGLACILIILALIFKYRRGVQRGLMIFVVILLWLSSNRWISYALARSLEWQNLPPENTPRAQVMVVLGGGTESGDAPRPMTEVNSAGDRVLYAAKLFKAGAASTILLSGGNVSFSSAWGMTPAEEMADLLALIGIPADAVLLQPNSQNTYEDTLYSSVMLRERGIDEIILVTSAMHMPRAKALFEKQGFSVIPAPVDFTVTEKNWENAFKPSLGEALIYLFPNDSALGLTSNALKEYLGMFVYGLRDWL